MRSVRELTRIIVQLLFNLNKLLSLLCYWQENNAYRIIRDKIRHRGILRSFANLIP